MIGQIGLLSLWVVSSRSGAAWRLCAASLGAALLAAVLTTPMNASADVLAAYALLSFLASIASCGAVCTPSIGCGRASAVAQAPVLDRLV